MPDQRRVRNARIVEPAAVVVVKAVAGGHVEPRVLDLLELLEPAPAGFGFGELGVDLVWRAALHERRVDPGLDRQARQPAQLGVGPEQEHVDAGDHLRDVLVGDVRQVALAELDERAVRAVAEQQELEVVLPHQVVQPQRAAVGVEHLVERGVAVVAERDLVGLVLGEVRDLELTELADQRLHLRAPLAVQLAPVLEVVAGALLEELGPLGDLGRVGHRVARDVDVAVHAPVVDPHRRRHREHAVLPRPHRLVRRVDADHVERRHRHREVHRVPEPEPVLVRVAPALVEQRVVRVHLLPALAPGRGLDLVRARECPSLRRGCSHPLPLEFLVAVHS